MGGTGFTMTRDSGDVDGSFHQNGWEEAAMKMVGKL